MFANGYKTIFHYHLRKCGGTSLNSWIQWHVLDHQTWIDPDPAQFNAGLVEIERERELATISFHRVPAVYTHRPFVDQAPPGTFKFTVLREPIARIISQVADWRREIANGSEISNDAIGAAIREVAFLDLKTFLTRHAYGTLIHFFDNYETRAIAASSDRPDVWRSSSPFDLMQMAKDALHVKYELVGLTEQMAETRMRICSHLGLVPDAGDGAKKNVTGGKNVSEREILDAAEVLEQLTVCDNEVYRCAADIFEGQHISSDYDLREFDSKFAGQAVERLRPALHGKDLVISVRDVLLGSGFWGRDGAGDSNCAVWTGPGNNSILYFPCPPGVLIDVKVWIRGYASHEQREQLRFEIDGKPVSHQFCADDTCHEVAIMTVRTTRRFLRLSILVSSLTSLEAGYGTGDLRKRGISFDRYGWSSQV